MDFCGFFLRKRRHDLFEEILGQFQMLAIQLRITQISAPGGNGMTSTGADF